MPGSWHATTFRSLGTRNFRLFFVGQLVSQTGTWAQSVAIIWVVLQLTDDGVALGLATAAQFLPVLVLGAWAGVVADRVDRHRFLLCTQVAFAVVAVAFAGLAFTDRLGLPAIYALSALFGIVTALDNPARRSLVVEMVAERDVPNAVGLNSALMTGSRVAGPALGGVLITGVGADWCFAFNAATYLAVLVALARIDRSALRSAPRVVRGRGQLREGFRYVWRTPELRLPLILLAVIGTLSFEFQVTLPLLAERTFGGDAGTFTLLYSAMSAGSLAGALVVARRTDADTRFLARSALGLAASMAALAVAPSTWVALVAVVPVGLTSIFLISGSNAVIQLRADPSMRGRALALTAVVFLGSTPIGGPITGAVGEHLGARAGIGLGAVAALAAGVWTLRALSRLPSPAGGATQTSPPEAPAVVRS
ncbi:MAG: MFS transporter [Acidimicrobiia bacterium]